MNKPLIIAISTVVIAGFMTIEWRLWRHFSSDDVTASSVGSALTVLERTDKEQPSFLAPEEILPGAKSVHATDFGFIGDLSVSTIKAQLSPVNETTLAAEISGRVSSIPFQEGEPFFKGDLLIEFDCSLQRAQLQRVTAQAEIASRNHYANQRLHERGAVSRLDAENSASERQRALAEVKELTVLVDKCHIFAPYHGKVAQRMARVEQFVQAGQPVLEILDDSAMELEFIVPSAWISWLRKAYPLSIRMDETNKTYPASVIRIGAKIDSISRTVKVVAVIEGSHSELIPGMSGTIHIQAPASAMRNIK